jgi:hypothetical protein
MVAFRVALEWFQGKELLVLGCFEEASRMLCFLSMGVSEAVRLTTGKWAS